MYSPQSRLMNTVEAADFLNLSVSFLNKLRLTGAGPVFAKLGARVGYEQQDLINWVQSRKQRSTSETGRGA